MPTTAEICFDNWAVRGQPAELLRDGVRVRLQELPLQVLEELLAHPGQVVTREQLIARLWPKRIVDYDSALNAAVRRLRATLGDEAETPRYIETIPRHGYRFIGTVLQPQPPADAAVEAASTALPSSWLSTAWVATGVFALLVVIAGIWAIAAYDNRETRSDSSAGPTLQTADRAIVVLPFVDMSAGRDQEYFSDGLTEELISQLAAQLPLRVIARTSSFSFKGDNADIASVANRLGVTHVLEGSVRRSGDQVRITAQLIDASTSAHLWTQTYDRRLNDFVQVQDEIARSVASELQIALNPQPASSAPGDARAYEHFFRARFFFHRRSPGDMERARDYYQQAITIDPDFAPAWAGLAGVHWIRIATRETTLEEGREQVREAAQQALQIDPTLAEAHLRMANYLASTGDTAAAAIHERQAMVVDPNNPFVITYAASDAAAADRFDEAIELMRRAIAADPLSANLRGSLASLLYLDGQFEEARTEFLRMQEIAPATLAEDLGLVLIQLGRFDEALAVIDALPAGPVRTQRLALVYQALGRTSEADAALGELLATAQNPFLIAEVVAYRGETDAAFKWLQADSREPERLGPIGVAHWIKRKSPFLRSLHPDSRWDAWYAHGS